MRVQELIETGRLARVEPASAMTAGLVDRARLHLVTAEMVCEGDPAAALSIAGSAVRAALLAALRTEGLAVVPADDGDEILLAALAESVVLQVDSVDGADLLSPLSDVTETGDAQVDTHLHRAATVVERAAAAIEA